MMFTAFGPAQEAAPAEPVATKPGVCLVLGGGGARGLAHVGVLKVLDEMGLKPACVVGTSAGALVGSLYCSGVDAKAMEKLLHETDFNEVIRDTPNRRLLNYSSKMDQRPPSLSLEIRDKALRIPQGVMEGERVIGLLNDTFFRMGTVDIRDFDRLPVPFRAIAADVRSGKLVVFDKGRLTQAVRASIAVPLVFTPVHMDDMVLVDGGVLNNVAVDVAKSLGYRKVLAINVARPPAPEKKRLDNLFDIMDEAYTLARREKDAVLLAMADVVVEPDMEGVSVADFEKVDELVGRGYASASQARDKLAALFRGEPAGPEPRPVGTGKYDVPVRQVGVEGAKNVSAGLVLHNSDIRSGDKATADEIGESVENIYAMDRFRKVDYDLSFHQGMLSLNYLVEERPRQQIDLTLHFDTDYKFLGYASFVGRRLLGTRSDLELRFVGGLVQDIRAILSVPFTFGSQTFSMNVGGYYTSIPRELFLNKQNFDDFTEKKAGLQAGTSFSFGRYFGLNAHFNVERVNIRSKGYFDEEDTSLDSFFTLGAGVDTLDDWHFPRKGFRFDANVEKHVRMFNEGENYARAWATTDIYFPVPGKMVVNLSGTFAQGWDIPIYRVFYAGGMNQMEWASARMPGYRLDELFGKDVWTASLELRRQLNFHSAGVVDASYFYVRAGVAGVRVPMFTETDYSLDTPLRSYNGLGVGVALATRIGPVRLFVGVGEDHRVNWIFTVGPEF